MNTNTGATTMSFNKPVRRIAVVGTGVIGASWAAYYLSRGFDVVATDPAASAEANLRKYVDNAWPGLDPRVEFFHHHHGCQSVGLQAPRALRDRPPLQSPPYRSAGRSGRWGEDLRGGDRTGHVVLRIDRQEADSIAQGRSGPCRQPPPGRALQGDVVSDPAGRAG